MDQQNPHGDHALKRALVDRFAEGVEWIRSTRVDVTARQRVLSFGRGHRFDTSHYIDTCRRIVLDGGGRLLLGTETERLLFEDGAVVGAVLRSPDGAREEVRARATLVATGGFQGDPELRIGHVHPHADRMRLRSNPHSRGGGYRLATHVGAGRQARRANRTGRGPGRTRLPPRGMGLRRQCRPRRREAVQPADLDRAGPGTRPGTRPPASRRTPYYVIKAVPAITFPFHGVHIDARARVLRETGEPIPGLLAAGSGTGGLWHRAYAGGLAAALVFGLTAADTAGRTSRPQPLQETTYRAKAG